MPISLPGFTFNLFYARENVCSTNFELIYFKDCLAIYVERALPT